MKMKNNSFSEIKSAFEKAKTVLILTHVIIDGDAAGSAAALCRVLNSLGKTTHIFTGEEIPHNLKIIDFDGFVRSEDELLSEYDLAVAVDCSDMERFKNRQQLFERGKFKLNLDHHSTNNYFADMNYVDGNACAAGEIIYKLIRESEWPLDVKTAEAIYTAIVTDTGEFQYSSTTAETHRITAELFDAGIDLNALSVCIFQSERKQKYLLQSCIMQTLEFRENDRFGIAFADMSMYEKTGSNFQDSDGMVEIIRNIDGIEISAFAKEIEPGVIKLGFRSKHDIDVSQLAAKFGGGGHKKAAGCTIYGSIQDMKDALYPEISKIFNKESGNN